MRNLTLVCCGLLLFALPLGGQSGGEDSYEMNLVQTNLKISLDAPGFTTGAVVKNLQRLGDGVSIAILKVTDESSIAEPKMVEAFLPLIHHAFSYPPLISVPANRDPKVTLFLLGHLQKDLVEVQTKQHIQETMEYVKRQVAEFASPSVKH